MLDVDSLLHRPGSNNDSSTMIIMTNIRQHQGDVGSPFDAAARNNNSMSQLMNSMSSCCSAEDIIIIEPPKKSTKKDVRNISDDSDHSSTMIDNSSTHTTSLSPSQLEETSVQLLNRDDNMITEFTSFCHAKVFIDSRYPEEEIMFDYTTTSASFASKKKKKSIKKTKAPSKSPKKNKNSLANKDYEATVHEEEEQQLLMRVTSPTKPKKSPCKKSKSTPKTSNLNKKKTSKKLSPSSRGKGEYITSQNITKSDGADNEQQQKTQLQQPHHVEQDQQLLSPPMLLERGSSHTISSDGEASFYDDAIADDFKFAMNTELACMESALSSPVIIGLGSNRLKRNMTGAELDALRSSLKVSLHQAVNDAASIGRLTRLNEKVVESVAVESTHNVDVDTWTGVKSSSRRTRLDRSNHFKIIKEAAAMGQLRRVKPQRSKLGSWNEEHNDGGEKKQWQEGMGNKTPHFLIRGRRLASSSSEQIEQYVRDKAREKRKTLYADEHVLERQEQNEHIEERFESGDLGWLPSLYVPIFKRPKAYLSLDRRRTAVAQEAAKLGEKRSDRLRCAFYQLIITNTCKCTYCKNPNPMQTQAYHELRQEYYRNIKTSGDKNPILTQNISLTPTSSKMVDPSFLYSRSALRRVSSLPPLAYAPFEMKESQSPTWTRANSSDVASNKEIPARSTPAWSYTRLISPAIEKAESLAEASDDMMTKCTPTPKQVDTKVDSSREDKVTISIPLQPYPVHSYSTPKVATEPEVNKSFNEKRSDAPVWSSPVWTSSLRRAETKVEKTSKMTKSLPVWASPALKKAETVKKSSTDMTDKNAPIWALATGKRDGKLPEWASETLKKMISR